MNFWSRNPDHRPRLSRAQGCLLGQLAGDALGSLVEFQSPEEIRRSYPEGVRELADGGTWNTIAGQPTDDSEMAMLLARMLILQLHFCSLTLEMTMLSCCLVDSSPSYPVQIISQRRFYRSHEFNQKTATFPTLNATIFVFFPQEQCSPTL